MLFIIIRNKPVQISEDINVDISYIEHCVNIKVRVRFLKRLYFQHFTWELDLDMLHYHNHWHLITTFKFSKLSPSQLTP